MTDVVFPDGGNAYRAYGEEMGAVVGLLSKREKVQEEVGRGQMCPIPDRRYRLPLVFLQQSHVLQKNQWQSVLAVRGIVAT